MAEQAKKLLNESFINDVSVDNKDEKCLYIEGVFMGAEKRNRNGRIYPRSLIEREVNTFNKLIESNEALGELEHPECFANPDFQILTESGWKEFLEIEQGDMVWTRDNKSKKAVLNPVEKIIDKSYVGDVYKVYGKNFYGEFTEKHRFLVEDRNSKQSYVTIKDIFDNRTKYSHYSIPTVLDVSDGDDSEEFTFPGVEPLHTGALKLAGKEDPREPLTISKMLFCKILGLWLAEGSRQPRFVKDGSDRGTVISVVQSITSNPDKCKEIDDLWKQIPENIKTYIHVRDKKKIWIISDMRIGMYFSKLGNLYTKHLPEEVFKFSNSYLEQILYWFALGDGRCSKHKKTYGNLILDNVKDVFSVSKELIDGLAALAAKCGLGTAIRENIAKREYVYAGHVIKPENKKPLYILSLKCNTSVSLDPRNLKITKIENEEAGSYCISVKNTNFYAKMHGKTYWTGNCSKINPKEAAIKIVSLKMDEDFAIGKAKVLDYMPNGHMLANLLGDVRMGVSSRGVGDVDESTGIVESNFHLITIDAVYGPSCPDSYVNAVNESYEWVLNESANLYVERLVEKKPEQIIQTLEPAKEAFDKKLDTKGSKAVAEAFKEFFNVYKHIQG